jgi:hypothetical protein
MYVNVMVVHRTPGSLLLRRAVLLPKCGDGLWSAFANCGSHRDLGSLSVV